RAVVARVAAVPAHVLESHPRVEEGIDVRIQVQVLLPLPPAREPVDDAHAVGAHDDAPGRVVANARPKRAQRFANRLQLLAVVGGHPLTSDRFIDLTVRPFEPVRPGARSWVAGACSVGVRDHRVGHVTRIRSQLAHCTMPSPVRTARRSSIDTGRWQPPHESPMSGTTAGCRRALTRSYNARSARATPSAIAARLLVASAS